MHLWYFPNASSHWHLLGNSKFLAVGLAIYHCLKIVSYSETWIFSFCFLDGDSRHSGHQKQEWNWEIMPIDLISAVWLGSAWRILQGKMGSWNCNFFLIWSLNALGLGSAKYWALWSNHKWLVRYLPEDNVFQCVVALDVNTCLRWSQGEHHCSSFVSHIKCNIEHSWL